MLELYLDRGSVLQAFAQNSAEDIVKCYVENKIQLNSILKTESFSFQQLREPLRLVLSEIPSEVLRKYLKMWIFVIKQSYSYKQSLVKRMVRNVIIGSASDGNEIVEAVLQTVELDGLVE